MEKKPLTPEEQKIMGDVVAMVRVKHESWRTGEAYGHAVINYRRWLRTQPHLREVTSEERLRAYLTAEAPTIAAKTQNQRLWDADQVRKTNPVQVPESVGRKIPQSGSQWGWFWVFPSANLSMDPETCIIRRHHVTRNCLQKAVKTSAVRAAIHKRVTVHTLRHTFATHHLERGTHIEQLRQLLGHESIETTMIYLHCLPKAVNAAGSPLDDIEPAGQLLTFPVAPRAHHAIA